MLTKDEIKEIAKFNPSTLKEGLGQAEQRLNDSFKKKENIERKAFTLLSMFLSFSTVLFSVPKILKVEESLIYWATISTGLCFLAGAIFLFKSLKALNYGTLGRYPDTWLQQGILDGNEDTKSYVLANVLFDYQKSIETSDESNSKKIKLVDKGMKLGIVSPILFLACLSTPYVYSSILRLLQLFL